MPLFGREERLFLMNMDSENNKTNDTKSDKNAELEALALTVKNLENRIVKLETENKANKALLDNIEKNKASTMEVKKVKKILNIQEKPKQQNLNSNSLDPLLARIGASAHIPNVSDLGISVLESEWKFKDSHFDSIAKVFGNSSSIVKIVQLQSKINGSGHTSYPINIYFSSETHRSQAVSYLRNKCKANGLQQPNIQFSLSGFPDVQSRVKQTTSILHNLKANNEISKYCISNFCLSDNVIIPLYQVKCRNDSSWSKTKECKTVSFFSSEISAKENSEQVPSLADLIKEHVKKIQACEGIPPPPPKITLHNLISDKLAGQEQRDNAKSMDNTGCTQNRETTRSPSKRPLQREDINQERGKKIPRPNSSFISAFKGRDETLPKIPPPFPLQPATNGTSHINSTPSNHLPNTTNEPNYNNPTPSNHLPNTTCTPTHPPTGFIQSQIPPPITTPSFLHTGIISDPYIYSYNSNFPILQSPYQTYPQISSSHPVPFPPNTPLLSSDV